MQVREELLSLPEVVILLGYRLLDLHDEIRGLIKSRFSPRAVKDWDDQVRRITRQVLDLALPKGEFDFVHEVSSEIPMQVFAEILGIPLQQRRYIIELGDHLLGNQDPEYARPPEDPSHRLLPFSSPVALEMFKFGRTLANAGVNIEGLLEVSICQGECVIAIAVDNLDDARAALGDQVVG